MIFTGYCEFCEFFFSTLTWPGDKKDVWLIRNLCNLSLKLSSGTSEGREQNQNWLTHVYVDNGHYNGRAGVCGG